MTKLGGKKKKPKNMGGAEEDLHGGLIYNK